MSALVALVALLATAPLPQQDLKNPQPAVDANGKPIPGNFTVTICRGTFYDMTPRAGGRDRYTTPHDVRVTKTTGTSARGGSHGTNGTIRFTSGAPGITGPLGETTIEYDIIDEATGRRDQHVIVKVKVIDCPPPARGGGGTTVPATPGTAGPRPPANPPAQGQSAQRPPSSNRQATHRTTSCDKCQSIAAALNAAADKGDSLAAAALSKELDQCELNCRLDKITEKIDWKVEMSMGTAFPISSFREEASTGFSARAGLYRAFNDAFGVGLNFDWSRFGNAEAMPSDFSASRLRLGLDLRYGFTAGALEPYVSGGPGISRNTLNFGAESFSEWKFGVAFGGGLGFSIGERSSIGVAVHHTRHDPQFDLSLVGFWSYSLGQIGARQGR